MDMIRLIAFTLMTSIAGLVFAEECRNIRDNTLRLICYDEQDKSAQPEQSKPTQEKKDTLLEHVIVRDSIGPNAKDAGSLSLTRINRDTASVTKIGVTLQLGNSGLPEYLQRQGWGWYFGAALNRDTLSKQETNATNAEGGASGTFFSLKEDRFSLLSQVSINTKVDNVAITKSNGMAFDTTLILPKGKLEEGTPYSEKSAYFIKPHAGYYFDDFVRVKNGATPGTASGFHINVDGEYYPGGSLWRVKLYADSRRALDFENSTGMTRRSGTYNKIGVDYALIDPRAEKPIIIPSLALERVVGGYFLDGTQLTAQTRLMFKLKIN